MPDAEFYRGLTLAEKVEKFLDHHSDEAVRHISADEVAILKSVIVRLRQPVTEPQTDS